MVDNVYSSISRSLPQETLIDGTPVESLVTSQNLVMKEGLSCLLLYFLFHLGVLLCKLLAPPPGCTWSQYLGTSAPRPPL